MKVSKVSMQVIITKLFHIRSSRDVIYDYVDISICC